MAEYTRLFSNYATRYGFHYLWEISYRDGVVLPQFESTENRADLERPISLLRWIPADPRLQTVSLEVPLGTSPILFRRVYQIIDGPAAIAYCLGLETQSYPVERKVWYIAPAQAVVIRSREGELLVSRFPGSLESSKEAEFVCALEKWITRQSGVEVDVLERALYDGVPAVCEGMKRPAIWRAPELVS